MGCNYIFYIAEYLILDYYKYIHKYTIQTKKMYTLCINTRVEHNIMSYTIYSYYDTIVYSI